MHLKSSRVFWIIVTFLTGGVVPTVGRLFINNFYNIGRDSVMGYSSLGNTLDSKRYLFSTDRRNVALKIPTITASDETVQVLSSGGKPSNIFDKPIIDARNFAQESSVSSSISSVKKVSTFRGIWNFLSWLFAAKQPDARTQLNDAHTNKIGASPTATNGRKQDPRRKSFELSYRQKLIDDGKSAYHPIILQCFEHFRFVTEKSATLIDKNKKYLQLAGKSVVGIWIGVILARKLIHWYTGISEFEVLLDRRDHSYHSQGAILHDIGRSLVSSLNHTAVAELKYDPLYDKVVAALEKPCYPQTMSTYSVQSGRSTAVLLSEIDNRIRVYRRRLSRQRAAGAHRGGYMAGGTAAVGAGVAQSSHALGTDQKTGTASAQNSPLDLADHIDYASLRSVTEEGNVLLTLQRGITLVQARQTDALLRLTRTQLLSAANTLEDLLALRREKDAHSSRSIYSSAKLSLKGAKKILPKVSPKKFPAEEKNAVLEGMLLRYYTQASMVQKQLDKLVPVEQALLAATSAQCADYSRDVPGKGAWEALSGWVTAGSSLATQSLQLLLGSVDDEVLYGSPPASVSPDTSSSSNPSFSTSAPSSSFSTAASFDKVSQRSPSSPDVSRARGSADVSSAQSLASSLNPQALVLSHQFGDRPTQVGRREQPDSLTAVATATTSTPATAEEGVKSTASSVAHAVLTAITTAVFGETSTHNASSGGVERTAVIAQLALMAVHLLSSTHNSDTEIQIAEFTLEGDVTSVVAGSVVHGHPLYSALQQSGHEITLSHDWEPVHRNNLTFARHLSRMDGGVLNTTLLNNMWYREVRYRSLHSNALLEQDPVEYTLLQVLNTAGKILVNTTAATTGTSADAPTAESAEKVLENAMAEQEKFMFVGTSAVLLALYMDLSSHSVYTDGASCSLKWVFTPLPAVQPAAPQEESPPPPVVALDAHIPVVYKSRRSSLRRHRLHHSSANDSSMEGPLSHRDNLQHQSHHQDNITVSSPPSLPAAAEHVNTRVRVTMNFSAKPGIYHLLQRHYAVQKMKAFVDSWKAAAVDAGATGNAEGPLFPSSSDNTLASNQQALTLTHSRRELQHIPSPVETTLLSSLQHNIAIASLQDRQDDGAAYRSKTRRIRAHYATTVDPTAEPRNAHLLRLSDDDGAVYFHSILDNSAEEEEGSTTGDSASVHQRAPFHADYRTKAPASSTQGTSLGESGDAHQQLLEEWSRTVQVNFQRHKEQWRASGVILQDLQRAPSAFSDHLTTAGLMKKSRRGILGLIRVRTIVRLAFWCAVAAGGLELTKKSNKLSFRAEVVAQHINSFVERRVVKPLTNILNDVVLNKRVSITDQAALKDAKRSLSVMLYDFLLQHCKSMGETERRRIANTMDMRPISEEYEHELRRPMQSIVSGKIARLVLIQLQFVKKELLVAMQAIDDLFNANQVNLQLLAITPAVLSLVSLNIISKTLLAAVRTTSRGRKVESTTAIQKEIREGIRAVEMVFLLSPSYHSSGFMSHSGHSAGMGVKEKTGAAAVAATAELKSWEAGRVLSHLHRLQNILVASSNFFDSFVLKQLQEDLRDLTRPELSTQQRLAIVERIYRAFPVLQPSRKIWGSALIQ